MSAFFQKVRRAIQRLPIADGLIKMTGAWLSYFFVTDPDQLYSNQSHNFVTCMNISKGEHNQATSISEGGQQCHDPYSPYCRSNFEKTCMEGVQRLPLFKLPFENATCLAVLFISPSLTQERAPRLRIQAFLRLCVHILGQ